MAQRHSPYQRRDNSQRQRLYQAAMDIFTRETIEENHRLADMIADLQDRNHQLGERLTHATNDAIEGHLDAEVWRRMHIAQSEEYRRLCILYRRIVSEYPDIMEEYEDEYHNIVDGAWQLHANEVIDLTNED